MTWHDMNRIMFPLQCFCECANGYGYEQCCEDGLVFNEDIERCDWPYNIPEC